LNETIRGFRFSAVAAGIKAPDITGLDLGLIVSDAPAVVAGVTTTNLVIAAPVAIARERLRNGLCQAIIANSGNANAFTGDRGREDALQIAGEVARRLRINAELVIPMSTGVIGNPLPTTRMIARVPDLIDGLDQGRFMDFARSIMTTDTEPKTVVLDGEVSSGPMRMIGIAKGAGMIAPNMATMLAAVLIDARVEQSFLKECVQAEGAESFNCITIDGDQSTNDTLIAMAGGRADAPDLTNSESDRRTFSGMLTRVCSDLARMIVADGEGASKLVKIRVCGAPDKKAASQVARTIAESLLVKTALCGEDPNWGRIIAAAGRAGVDFDPDRIGLSIGEVAIVKDGRLEPGDWEARAKEVMGQREFEILVDLKSGAGEAVFLTTDLSEDYVRINADYRS
jgi:glutamate N-acetyltransferase/amino-acid N-acetyltransferase